MKKIKKKITWTICQATNKGLTDKLLGLYPSLLTAKARLRHLIMTGKKGVYLMGVKENNHKGKKRVIT